MIERDGVTASDESTTYMTAPEPVYSSSAKYFRAAEAVAAELPRLAGTELIRQQAWVQHLLAAGRNLEAEQAGTRSGIPRSQQQAQQPHLGMPREQSVNSPPPRQLQIMPYDPVVAGKRAMCYVETPGEQVPRQVTQPRLPRHEDVIQPVLAARAQPVLREHRPIGGLYQTQTQGHRRAISAGGGQLIPEPR
jgi:hypothetical protein